jgi:TRAP-type C4-dicarboxylate transport system permease small subunit
MGELLHWPKVVLTRVLEFVVIVLVALLVLDVLWGVFTRFIVDSPSQWTEQIAKIFLMWVAILGAAPAFSRNEHLGIDYFTGKLDPAAQRLVGVASHAVVIVFACWAMVYGGWVLVSETLASGQLDPVLQVPVGYLYSPVLVSGIAIVIISLQQMGDLLAGKNLSNESAGAAPPASGEAS